MVVLNLTRKKISSPRVIYNFYNFGVKNRVLKVKVSSQGCSESRSEKLFSTLRGHNYGFGRFSSILTIWRLLLLLNSLFWHLLSLGHIAIVFLLFINMPSPGHFGLILSYLDEGFKMSLLVVEQSIPMGDYQNDRYSTRRKILVVYDTKMTDIWKTHQSDRC